MPDLTNEGAAEVGEVEIETTGTDPLPEVDAPEEAPIEEAAPAEEAPETD